MEVLLDLLVTVRFEVETENPTTVSVLQNEEDRQMLARPEEERASGNCGDADRTPERDRKTLARAEWPPQPGAIRLRFSAPMPIIQHWLAAIGWVEEKCLPLDKNRAPIPTWAAVALLLDGAIREWTRTDPESIPTERKVMERDEYCCGAPGCTRRRTLESHHVELKSQGGSDRPHNRRAACHGHHRLIHLGYIRVTGRAPGALHWEIGRKRPSPDSEPIWRLLGERFEDENEE
jgi:hypothetical protein